MFAGGIFRIRPWHWFESILFEHHPSSYPFDRVNESRRKTFSGDEAIINYRSFRQINVLFHRAAHSSSRRKLGFFKGKRITEK